MKPLNSLLQEQTTLLDLTGKQCDKHGDKLINTIRIDGEEVCPICERDRNEQILSQQQTELIRTSHMRKGYETFSKKSILTDTALYKASFGTFEANEPEEIRNKERALKAFEQYKKGEVFNTWLTGLPATGKSHLAMSILRNLNESGQKDKTCVFVSVDEMLRHIRSSFSNKESTMTESYFVEMLSNADYIVLDDLGAETGGTGSSKQATDFTLRVLYGIANARQNKSTIITSNLSKSELTHMYDAKLVSRLMKDTYLIGFKETSDKRIKNIEF